MCTNENKGSNAVSFAMGTAIGAGLGVFLSTKKGKKLIKQAWKQIEPYLDDVVENAKGEFEDFKVKAQAQAESIKNRAVDQFDQTVEEVKELAEEKLPPSIKKPIKRTFFKGV